MFFLKKKAQMPDLAKILPGRSQEMPVPPRHAVLPASLSGPFPGMSEAMFGMGCFWGAERKFWQAPGVVSTAVGYAAGGTPNPTYEEVCSGLTGHNEVVRVIFDATRTSYDALLRIFWENHNPTQGMQQGNDVGTQYRSGIYCSGEAQLEAARSSLQAYQQVLERAGFGAITTEVIPAPTFYFAEAYHQQYLHKNPGGYCGLGGTGVACPVGLSDARSG